MLHNVLNEADRLMSAAQEIGQAPAPDWPKVQSLIEEAQQLGHPKADYALATSFLLGYVVEKKSKKSS